MVIRQQNIITDNLPDKQKQHTPAVAVDLDGTLVKVNTFRKLILFLIKKLFIKKRYRALSGITMLLMARKGNLISHVTLKYPVHRIATETLTADELAEFIDILKREINPELMKRLKIYKETGYKIIIATAAPELYVKELCRSIGFDAYIATALSPTKKGYTEVRGDRKVSELKRFASEHGLDIEVVASDHEDDLPLLTQEGVTRILVNPTTQLRMQIRSTGLPFEHIP